MMTVLRSDYLVFPLVIDFPQCLYAAGRTNRTRTVVGASHPEKAGLRVEGFLDDRTRSGGLG